MHKHHGNLQVWREMHLRGVHHPHGTRWHISSTRHMHHGRYAAAFLQLHAFVCTCACTSTRTYTAACVSWGNSRNAHAGGFVWTWIDHSWYHTPSKYSKSLFDAYRWLRWQYLATSYSQSWLKVRSYWGDIPMKEASVGSYLNISQCVALNMTPFFLFLLFLFFHFACTSTQNIYPSFFSLQSFVFYGFCIHWLSKRAFTLSFCTYAHHMDFNSWYLTHIFPLLCMHILLNHTSELCRMIMILDVKIIERLMHRQFIKFLGILIARKGVRVGDIRRRAEPHRWRRHSSMCT